VLVSDWNWPDAVAGKGSAIFVHHWRRPRYPTAGCIALRPDHLRWILARWTARNRIIVRD
jgi:L,D-peptidoglycan transpeptidase YkuD (ErfK/YbiS/YcfS/YnhG family)